ncbi:hypothetical protein B0T26DRAFT_692892 [Lasiosphaeria miniovina]|uniref:Uncharacterized protein n=1 Tax=Lasiosphaeria miniovina TaxID=1954250 RepID=A0AA40B3X0_9PEZI|nr:uncharacterized protein B0T26DRAFT_692892 [Lasiosphaeria miniovina]KAK0727058.1 hypothetical protein B0T26DRAFT_692892 [Lasiosphaeria miniovina]
MHSSQPSAPRATMVTNIPKARMPRTAPAITPGVQPLAELESARSCSGLGIAA